MIRMLGRCVRGQMLAERRGGMRVSVIGLLATILILTGISWLPVTAERTAHAVGQESPAANVDSKSQTAPVADDVAKQAASKRIGQRIDDFDLLATDGTQWKLSAQNSKVLVVTFTGVECPLANLYLARLNELSQKWKPDEVQFVSINSNEQDTLQQVRDQATRLQLKIPQLKDPANRIANKFQASRTPESFVLDAERVVRYHGRIDDQYGYSVKRAAPSQQELLNAVQAVLAGRSPEIATTAVQGCIIGRQRTPRADAGVTFYKDVLPVFQNRCQSCHRPGELAPFSLEDYAEASGWAETIKEVIQDRRMPPWPADSTKTGRFENELCLNDAELALLTKWVDSGAPAGDVKEAPPKREWVEGWNIGTPDAVYAMEREFQVPATGEVKYQFFAVTPVFEEDRWVQAIECRPGNKAVVHHILAVLVNPKKPRESQDGVAGGFFGAYAPGAGHIVFPPGQAKKIPAGMRVVFQMHYTTNGVAQIDRSSLGMVFATQPPEYEVRTYGLSKRRLLIPAGAEDHGETATLTVPATVQVTTMFPHLHVRGKSFSYRAEFPDGEKRELLSVPRWDFNWQMHYRFKEPLTLPVGTKLIIEAHWDNSEKNPNNILPLTDARWGDQTWDEMFIGYVDYLVPHR